MSHVFLSYARSDVERAKQLAQALEAHGFSVWWDRTIPPGKTFDQVIEEALEKADKVVVLWSASALASNWVRTEADVALERGVLVPVLIEDVLPPFSSRRIEAAELQRWSGDPRDPELQNLVAALRGTGPIPVRPRDPEPEPEPVRPPQPAPPPPVTGRSRSGLAVALGGIAILAALGIGLVVVLIAIQPDRQRRDEPGPPGPKALEEVDSGLSRPEPVAPEAPAAASAITFHYPPDPYGCQVNVNVAVGPYRFALPTATGYVLSGLSEGPAPYSLDGVISCPQIGACTVQGSGEVSVYDGAAFDVMWQNTAYAYCQASLQPRGAY